MRRRRRRARQRRGLIIVLVTLALLLGVVQAHSSIADGRDRSRPGPGSFLRRYPVQTLDGSGNNTVHPEWGRAGATYRRVAPARYADGRSRQVSGPDPRRLSNRLFNDAHQNVFSGRSVSQWGFAWGQFLDHTFGLRAEGGEKADLPFDPTDPMEEFTNDLGMIGFTRSKAAEGGGSGVRQQTNTVSSYIDAWAVYGGSTTRLEWMREGSVDGNPADNGARLLMPDGYLPRRDARGDTLSAPQMAVDGRLLGQPNRAVVAGDVRANENIALTSVQTLFAREHNRIVGLLPETLSEEERFQIARRVVIAEQQYITYTQFLPAMGVRLPAYEGYDPRVNATLTNEFATVGFRAHSQIHGELETEVQADALAPARVAALQAQGVEVIPSADGEDLELVVPLNVAFFNPDLVQLIGLGPLLEGLGGEAEYRNDEMIDNQLRSVLFQIPVPDNPRCLDGPELPQCFQGVVDLGAIDVQRGRDHGMPTYAALRRAYGLDAKASFRAITGERSQAFPADPLLTRGGEIDDPQSLDFVRLFDVEGRPIALDAEEAETSAVRGVRRTPLAARLRTLYGSVDRVDAFVGMVCEPQARGSELGELQRAMWSREFRALRDGDRFFYGNDPGLSYLKQRFGIDFRRTLGDVIADNTGIDRDELADDVFYARAEEGVL